MAKPIFQNVSGMPDILPRDRRFYDMVEKAALKIASYYGYEEVTTPILEYSELFEKGTGESTDIVQKQMYAFEAQGGDRLTVRPEFTPSLVRAYIQHGMASWPQPVKLCEIGPVLRHERPQSGRFREFRQFELDVFGENDPVLDVQIILMLFTILKAVGIKGITIQVNSIGCSKCRPNYRKVLREYYRGRERSLCKDCRIRKKVNFLRLLDCKDEKCERLKTGAPEMVDHLCMECHNHLKEVLETLDSLELPYALSPHLVRGLDYYTKTVFEIFASSEEEGEKMIALAGGGRFDDLTKLLGGDATPAVGGSLGVERIIARMRKLGIKVPAEKQARVFLVHLGDLAKRKSLKLLEDFRLSGLLVKEALGRPSIRAQMEIANKMQVDYALILGHQEVADDTIIIRDMKGGSQEVIPMGKLMTELKKRLK